MIININKLKFTYTQNVKLKRQHLRSENINKINTKCDIPIFQYYARAFIWIDEKAFHINLLNSY